jgi:hypothetical protein
MNRSDYRSRARYAHSESNLSMLVQYTERDVFLPSIKCVGWMDSSGKNGSLWRYRSQTFMHVHAYERLSHVIQD